ncbi:MAG TPA: phospholipid carrier-dependent glycosyltransferase [Candidatus Limnocylindria bacterium]
MRRDLVILFVLALVTRLLAALLVDYPPYGDPAYYQMIAEQLAAGHGFSAPVLWSFLEVGGRLPVDPMLPIPSNGHWMPLTSIVAAGSMAVFGDLLGSYRAAQLPMILLGAVLVPFTYYVAIDLWGSRFSAWIAALLVLTAGPLLVMAPLVDAFVVFGAAGSAAIWCSIRAVRAGRPGPWLVAAGAFVGLATLARVDGLLLAAAPAVAWAVHPEWPPRSGRLAWGFASFLAALAVLAPWFARDLSVFGSPLPSAGGHTLWITSYNQQFSIAGDPSLAEYLAWGPANIIGSKLAAWGELVGRTAVLLGGIFILPFAFGLWRERHRRELQPFLAYFVVMFLAMGAVFTFHAPKGAFYHSSLAWLPFGAPLAVASLAPMATAAGRAWPFLRRPATHRFLAVAGLIGAIVLSLVGSAVLLAQWSDTHARLRQAAQFLADRDAQAQVVMAYDPAALHALSGNPGVAPPFDLFPVIGQVAGAYDVRWVVVTLAPGETRDPLGLWDGAAATDAAGNHPDFLPAAPDFDSPGVRVFRVVDEAPPPSD